MLMRMIHLRIVLYCMQILIVSSQRSEHFCDSSQREKAGTSGSLELKGNCELTLQNLSGKINFAGISIDAQCTEKQQISVNSRSYCVDEEADIVIDATDEVTIEAKQAIPFLINYYHGELYSFIPHNVISINPHNIIHAGPPAKYGALHMHKNWSIYGIFRINLKIFKKYFDGIL